MDGSNSKRMRSDFVSTRWSLVVAANRKSSPDRRDALSYLCNIYWHPLYAYVRRRGYSASDAEDLTQEFFARLLEIALEAPDYSPRRPDLRGHLYAYPGEFAISPDGRSLIVVSQIKERFYESVGDPSSGWLRGSSERGPVDTVLELWDLEKRTRVAILNEETVLGPLTIAISHDLRFVATRPYGEELFSIRDLLTGKEIRLTRIPYFPVLKFSPDAKLLFLAYPPSRERDESLIVVSEVETGRQVRKWKGHRGGVMSLALSADGSMLASGGNDGLICLWDTRTGRKLAALEQADVSALAITRDAGTLVSGGTDGALKLWDLSFIRKELSSLGLGW